MSDFAGFLTRAFIRKWLAVLAGALLTYGYLTQAEADSFVGKYLEEIVGVAILGVSHVWTYAYQRYVKKKVVTALAMEKGSTPAQLKVEMGEGVTP